MTRLLTGLLELTLASGVLIALLLVLTPALAKRFSPRWRYWVWLALALRLAIPVNVPLPVPLVTLPAPAWTEGDSPRSAEMVRELEPELPAEAVRPLPAGPETGVYAGNVHTPFLHSSQVTVVENGAVVTNWLRQSIQWPNVLLALWAAGTAVALIRQLVRHRAFLRLCRRWRRDAAQEDQMEAERRAKALGLAGAPTLYRCAAVTTPLLTGLFRPVILLPAELSGADLSVALDHELTHWKRRDLWYKALLLWVRCLHWFNPLVQLMCRRAEGDLEQCCDHDLLDQRPLSDRQAYGEILLSQMTAGRTEGTRLTTGFSGSRREVLARFKALMDVSAKKKGRAALALAAALALLGSGLVACQAAPQPVYDPETSLYRDEAHAFEVTIPSRVMDQLDVIPEERGDSWTVSFVSRELREQLGDSFAPAEDYWLRVRLRRLDDGSTVRDVTFGEWNDLSSRCRAAGMDQNDLDAQADLYAAAADAYRSFVFSSDGDASGAVSLPAQQTGTFYSGDAEVYLNFDLSFGLDIPREIYDQLTVVTDLRRSSGFIAVFLDRRLVEELGWDPDAMLEDRTVFLSVEQAAGDLQVAAGDMGTLDGHPEFRAADQALREAVLEMASQAEAVAATLFDLDAVDDGLAEGDTYDPRLLYSYQARDDGVQISIPGWAMQQIRTSYDGGLLTFSTLAGDPLLYWAEGTGFTLPNLTSAELSDESEAGVLAYMDLQNTLLAAEWRSGKDDPANPTAIAYSMICPDGTYPVALGSASLNDSRSRLLFTPNGQPGGYYLPLAADAELKPLSPTPETWENEAEWVIFSGFASSAFPYLEVTVEDNRIITLACVLGEGPAEQQP